MILRAAAVSLAMLLGSVAVADATVIKFTGSLDGPSENPPVASPGTGTALVTYDSVAHTLTVDVVWQNLIGTTTVAHIHCCVDAPGTVGVATYPSTFPSFPVGVTSGAYTSPSPIDLTLDASYTAGFLTNFGGGTAAGAEAALLAGMLDGDAYFNIHSTFKSGGEIRGFLEQKIPEPGTMSLFGFGLGIFGGLLARRAARRKAR